MAEAADFIFRTNIDEVAEEIRRGLSSISQASNIPQTKAGKNLLSGISQDVEQETMRLAQQVRAYKEQLDQLQRAGTPLGKRQSLAQYTNEQLDQARGAFRTSALNRARGSGIATSDVASLVTEMEKAFLNRAANEIRGRARVAAGTPSASYTGQATDVRDNGQTRDIQRRYTRALEDQARNAERVAQASQQTAAASEQSARAATAGAQSAEQSARASARNAQALEDLAEANMQSARRAQQQAARPAPASPPRRPTDDIDTRTGLVRPPTGPYAGPWTTRTYQTGKVGQSETHHILDMAQSEGVDPGFTLTKNGIRVHDPNRARYELDGAYQAAFDNVRDASSPEDKQLYTQRRDSLRKLMDAIGSHRDALYQAVQEPSDAALADPAATRRREAHQASAGGASGGGQPPKPPAPPTAEPPEEPKPPKPPKPPIVHGDTDDEAKAERERLENAIAARVDDPNDPLRKLNKSTAYDPTTETFFRRKLSAANPEPELTRPVDIQHAREDLDARRESDHDRALRAEQRRADQEVIQQQRALAQEITQARRAEPEKIVRVTGTGGVRTGIEADLRDEANPRYFERVNAKRLRELDPQNPDDVLKLDESTRNLAGMRAAAARKRADQEAADAAKDKAGADKLDAAQTRDYVRQQTRDAADKRRQDAQSELDRQRAQRAGLESRLVAGDPTVVDVPRRGVFGGGYIDKTDPKNKIVYERESRGGLSQVDAATTVGQAKVGQALLSEAEAIDRASAATLRRARAEERSEAALDKQVANFGGGGIGAGFVRGFTAGGFGGSGEGGLEGLARSAGTATKYTAIYQALGLMTTAASQAVQQLLDMDDSITELQVAMGDASTVSGDFTNSLQDVAAEGGFNVGEAMDVAASGIRAFKDATDGSQQSVDALGEGFARQAQRIAVLSKTDLTDAGGNLKAAISGFDLTPNEASFRRITDAIAGGKLAGGGDEKDLSQFLASAAVSFKQAGFNPEETAAIGSKLISSLDESGTLAATRSSRLFSILQGNSGKTYLSQLNQQIGSLNQTRGKNDQIAPIDINASASQQVLELADAYSKLSKQEQQVLLNRIGGTGQSRELQVLLETVRKQTQEAAGGFDNKGVEEYQKRLDNIRARLNQIKGDVKAIVTNLASSGLFIPFEAALPVLQTIVRMMRELTQSIRFLEQIPGFGWVEQIALAAVAIRALTPAMRTLREGGVRGALGLAEARIAPGRALSRQRLQEAQEAGEVGTALGSRRVAGGGRLDVAVQEASAHVTRLAEVTGHAQDSLLNSRDRRARRVAELSEIPVTDARYGIMEREIAALDATIARRTEALRRLREKLGMRRDELESAGERQALGTKVNQRYDSSEESLASRRDRELAGVDAQQARDQRRRQRLGVDDADPSTADYDAQREAIKQRHANELAQINARRTAELDDVAKRDLNAPSGLGAANQRFRQGIRNIGENFADRGALGVGLQAATGVGGAARAATDALKGIPGAARGVKDDFQRLRTEGVSPLSSALRSLPGGNATANALGRLNGRDELGNIPLGGTRTQRFRSSVGNALSSNIGWFGGGLLAADAVMQIHDSYGQIQDAQKAGTAAASVDLVGASASALLDSSKSLSAAASNLDEATNGFSGFWADKLFNSGAGAAQADSLRGQAAFEEGEGTRIKNLQDRHAQAGLPADYASAIDQTSAQGLSDSLKALEDAGVPATERVKALAASIDRLNAVAAGTAGKFTDVELERQRADAGNTAIQTLQGLQAQNPTATGFDAVKSVAAGWMDDVRASAGMAPAFNNQNQSAVDLSNVDTQQVGEDAAWVTQQMQSKGIDLTKDDGLRKYQQLLQAKLTQSGVQGPGQAKAVADAVAKGLGRSVGNLDSFDDPYAAGVANAQQTVSQGQAMRQEVATSDQLAALQSGRLDTGVHASQALLDYFKDQRKRIETLLKNSKLTDEQAKVILGIIDQGEQQARIDSINEQRQQAQIDITHRGQRRQHDLQNITDPAAIETRRAQDNTTDILAALSTNDTDTAAQLMSTMPPDQIEAARNALQRKVDAERKKFNDQHKDFIGPLNPEAQDPHLAHLLHEQTLFGDAFGESAPQYTAGDIAASKQAADAAKSGSQSATDAANVATAEQGVLDAQRQYGIGSKQYWDAVGQVETAKRTQASDELERAIANRNILTDSSSALAQANAAIRDANDRRKAALARGDKDEAERQRLLGLKAEQDRKSAQLELGFLNKRKRIDITNPALLAKQEADEAQARAEAARKDPNTGKDHQAQFDQTAREARNNAEKVAHDQWLSDLQEKDRLGDISHRKFIESLQADIARLKAKKKLTYQEQKQLDDDREAMKAAQDQLSGQFNLGTIKLPSVYEVRRSLLAQAQPGTAGAPGTSTAPVVSAGSTKTTTAADTTKTAAVSAVNTTNNVTINGADFARVVDYLNKIFHKTQRIATTPRKA